MNTTDYLNLLLQGLKNGDHALVETAATGLSSWARGEGEAPLKADLESVCARFIAIPAMTIPAVPRPQTAAPRVPRDGWPYHPIDKPEGTLPHR